MSEEMKNQLPTDEDPKSLQHRGKGFVALAAFLTAVGVPGSAEAAVITVEGQLQELRSGAVGPQAGELANLAVNPVAVGDPDGFQQSFKQGGGGTYTQNYSETGGGGGYTQGYTQGITAAKN